jgi:hypothetical protein
MEVIMKTPFSLALAAVLGLGAAGAAAAELPTYEMEGFPITPHQIQVVGAGQIHEQSAISTLTLGGMPASPHQVMVLTPRPQ